MMRSLSSAVAGLKAQQTAMDVIGNNISNVNTNGFKSSSTNFSDTFYQTLVEGSAEISPSQVGYGAQVSNISKDMTDGGKIQTDRPTDLYINGAGFFAVNTKADGTGQTYFTRVGNFNLDATGHLVDSNGNYVLGVTVDNTGKATQLTGGGINLVGATFKPTDGSASITIQQSGASGATQANYGDITNIAVKSDGSITCTVNGKVGTITNGTDNVEVELNTFPNENGLKQIGNNYYIATTNSGAANITAALANGSSTTIVSNSLEASNVDLAKEITNMIVTQRGYQANSRVITVSDGMLEELVNLKRS